MEQAAVHRYSAAIWVKVSFQKIKIFPVADAAEWIARACGVSIHCLDDFVIVFKADEDAVQLKLF